MSTSERPVAAPAGDREAQSPVLRFRPEGLRPFHDRDRDRRDRRQGADRDPQGPDRPRPRHGGASDRDPARRARDPGGGGGALSHPAHHQGRPARPGAEAGALRPRRAVPGGGDRQRQVAAHLPAHLHAPRRRAGAQHDGRQLAEVRRRAGDRGRQLGHFHSASADLGASSIPTRPRTRRASGRSSGSESCRGCWPRSTASLSAGAASRRCRRQGRARARRGSRASRMRSPAAASPAPSPR